MKKLIAWVLLVTLLLGTFAGCGAQNTETPAASGDVEGINAAIDYLKAFYKDGGSQTGADFERFGIVRIGGVPYEVIWTADTDEVKAVVNDNGTVTIDVNEKCEKETTYKLTATVSDDAGNAASHSWEYILPASLGDDYAKIVDMAYALEKDAAMDYATTLVGTVTSINTAWSDEYKNITVTIIVEGREDKPIMCYRLKGEGAQDLAPGDLITVTGTLKNYNGTIEFDAGCTLDKVEKGAGKLGDVPSDPAEIVDAAYALEVGAALPYTATLTGEVKSIDTPYSADYKNVTVTITVEGREDKPIQCFRMKGTDADKVMPGDVITVSGTIKNYNGTIEFDAGCQLLKLEKGENSVEIPTDPQKILEAAAALKPGEKLPYSVTLTGKITGIGDRYSEKYGNVTVMIRTGDPWYPITCFRLKGEGVDKIYLDDVITVTGTLENYDGTLELSYGELVSWTDNPDPKAPSDTKQILKEAFALGNFATLPYYCSLTGRVANKTQDGVKGIEKKYDTIYKNVTVNMIVEGKVIQAYRLEGPGVEAIKEGDTITVYGMLKNYKGTIEFDSGCKLISKQSAIVDDLYELESGEKLEGEQVLTGTITKINYTYTSKNGVSVTMDAGDGRSVYCFKMKGTGADRIAVGDNITVRGTLKNYKGTYEFDQPTLVSWSCCSVPYVDRYSTAAEIVAAAQKLGSIQYLYAFNLEGDIISVDDAYTEKFGNVTVTMNVAGSSVPVQCYRMKGEGVDKIAVGDHIRVFGNLINYNGKVQFNTGCELQTWIDNTPDTEEPETPETPVVPETPTVNENSPMADVLAAAAALETGKSLGFSYTLTGTVQDAYGYNAQYGNHTGIMAVGDTTVQFYRMVGAGVDKIAEGDSITVTGVLEKNSSGYIRFAEGCTLKSWTDNTPDTEEPETPAVPTTLAEMIEDVKKLANNTPTSYTITKTGTVTSIKRYYSDNNNYNFVMNIEGYTIEGYSLTAIDGKTIEVGDSVTVTGPLSNFNGTVQFNRNCGAKITNIQKASS